ncbi:MAG: hypothetical protein ACI8QF_002045 [Limisphaerales bacterium]|jgi:hypothetical protein
MTARGPGGAHKGNPKAPVRKELSGPNQRWCWDISYLLTFQKGEYLYLLLEGGLVEGNILDLPEDQRPELINDRRPRSVIKRPLRSLIQNAPRSIAHKTNQQRLSGSAYRWTNDRRLPSRN